MNESQKEKKDKKDAIEWDRKKIIAFIIVLVLLIVGLYKMKTVILNQNSPSQQQVAAKKNVKGTSVGVDASDVKKNVQDQISKLKAEAANINLIDIASSSPQVQKVINDLKALQQVPGNELKKTCENICNGL